MKDLTQFKIDFTMEEIRKTPKSAWKILIKKKTVELSLASLNINQGTKSQQSSELTMTSTYQNQLTCTAT